MSQKSWKGWIKTVFELLCFICPDILAKLRKKNRKCMCIIIKILIFLNTLINKCAIQILKLILIKLRRKINRFYTNTWVNIKKCLWYTRLPFKLLEQHKCLFSYNCIQRTLILRYTCFNVILVDWSDKSWSEVQTSRGHYNVSIHLFYVYLSIIPIIKASRFYII